MGTAVKNLSPETLALIEAQARDRGISPDEYIRLLLPPEQELALSQILVMLSLKRTWLRLPKVRRPWPSGVMRSREKTFISITIDGIFV